VQALVDAYTAKTERSISAPVMDLKSSISYVKTALWTQKDKNLGDKGVTEEADKALLNDDDRLRAAKELSAKARKAWIPFTQYSMLRTRAVIAWMAAVDNREIDAMAPKLILQSQVDLQELVNRNSYNFVTELLEWHAEILEARLKNTSPMDARIMWLKPSNDDIKDFEAAWKKRQDDNRTPQQKGNGNQQPPNKDGDKDDKDNPRGRGGPRGGGGGKGKDNKGDGKGNRKPWEKRGSFDKTWQQRRDSRSRGDRRGRKDKDSRKRDRANRADSRGRSRGPAKKEKKAKRERSNSN
jgi:hypothetical protein